MGQSGVTAVERLKKNNNPNQIPKQPYTKKKTNKQKNRTSNKKCKRNHTRFHNSVIFFLSDAGPEFPLLLQISVP